MLIRWAAYKLVFAELPNFSRDAVMQLCLAQAFAAALFRGLQRALEALAIYATSRAEFGTGDVLAYTKALGSELIRKTAKRCRCARERVVSLR